MRSIISISLSSLENIGLRKILESIPLITLTVVDEFIFDTNDLDKYELIIVKPGVLAKNLSILLPLKSKVLVIVNGSCEAGGIFRTIGIDSRIESFISTISSILECNEGSNRLSSREVEVLKQLAAGKTQKEIADLLCICLSTVVTHRKNISAKLGIRSISGLALYAAINGYIKK